MIINEVLYLLMYLSGLASHWQRATVNTPYWVIVLWLLLVSADDASKLFPRVFLFIFLSFLAFLYK